ncbi:hypothetical protein HHI36_008590 [Cryptolaemus montrouzieri]|uniref:Uncharacterized protein n=1 Tax=Cryptolaemus montrouzieri TaxID=559131 RepID=A0ABD2MTN6_9CUCU
MDSETVPTVQDLYKEIVRNRTEIKEFIELKIVTKIEAIEEREASDISSELVCETLKSSLKIDLLGADIADFHSIGRNKNCPVKVKLSSVSKKFQIPSKGVELKGNNISISRDLTPQQRINLKTLREHLAIARKDPNVKSFMKRDELVVGSKSYNVQHLTTFTKKNDECNTEVTGFS